MADFDFSQLPEELIHLVMQRMSHIGDFVRFSTTCKTWESVVAAQKPGFPPSLMLTNDDTDAQNLCTFSCLSTKRETTIRLLEIRDRRCWGTPYGCLITLGLDFHFHLLNPFTGVRLSLPHLYSFPNQYQKKYDPEYVRQCGPRRLVLSSNPFLNQNQSCIVIAIYSPSCEIAFAKPGDGAWTGITTPYQFYEDAIYFNGHIYAIDGHQNLIVCDISALHPEGTQIQTPPPYNIKGKERVYLLELYGELHLVVRFFKYVEDSLAPHNDRNITQYFRV